MAIFDEFRRVTRGSPCPVCEHPDWCLISREQPPSKALCQRVASPVRWRDAGWLHVLRADERWQRPRQRVVSIPLTPTPVDLSRAAAEFVEAVRPNALETFAARLGVTAWSLQRLRVGWAGRAWSFPMTDPRHRDNVCGIRLRLPDGSKLSVTGGKEAIFVPNGLPHDGPLYVAEGPTDTAALLDLGVAAIGRPSCSGGIRHVIHFVRASRPSSVVVVADEDQPGQVGATTLASTLALYARDVRVITPPAKDAREWVRRGATKSDMESLIAAASAVQVLVRRGEATYGN